MVGGRIHTSHLTPLDLPLAISYRKHQKSLAYFSHLAPQILFFYIFVERQSQKQKHGTILPPPPPPPLIRSCPKPLILKAETLHLC